MSESNTNLHSVLDLYRDLHHKVGSIFPQNSKLLPGVSLSSNNQGANSFSVFDNFKPVSNIRPDVFIDYAQKEGSQSERNINSSSGVGQQNLSTAIMLNPTIEDESNLQNSAMMISQRGSKYKGRPKQKNHPQWKLKRVIAGHTGWVRSVSFDPSNEFFATGSTDRTIKFWDLATGMLKVTFTGHVSAVRCVEISKQHTYLFSSSEDKSVRCWDLNTNKCIRNYHGHLSGVYTLALHPELNLLASGGRDAVVRLWDIRSRQQIHVFEGHSDTVNSLIMQKDEPQLISSSSDSTIRMWDIVAGKVFNVLTNHKKGIRAIKAHPIEYTFVSGAADNIKLWKCPEGSFIRNFDKPNEYEIINTIDVSGEDVMVAGYDNGKMRFWDWESGQVFQTVESAPQPGSLEAEAGIFDLKFDHSSTRLVTCECDKTIKVWEQEFN
jgi:pleiotropic regulator 1